MAYGKCQLSWPISTSLTVHKEKTKKYISLGLTISTSIAVDILKNISLGLTISMSPTVDKEIKKKILANYFYKHGSRRKETMNEIISGSNYTRKCYEPLGCLEITEDWFGLTRPVNLLPLDREEINTQFFLRTKEKPQGVSSSKFLMSSG
jgi:hypothetical protein